MMVEPNFPAIIPDTVTFTVDTRHPDAVARARLYEMHESLMQEVAGRRSIDITWHLTTDHAPSTSHPEVVAALEEGARLQGVPSLTMPSGAAHDTQQMALIAERTAMVFVRSKDGRSHTPEEYSSLEDIVAGIEVLAAGLYRLAY
jgi:allantoate deiminase